MHHVHRSSGGEANTFAALIENEGVAECDVAADDQDRVTHSFEIHCRRLILGFLKIFGKGVQENYLDISKSIVLYIIAISSWHSFLRSSIVYLCRSPSLPPSPMIATQIQII